MNRSLSSISNQADAHVEESIDNRMIGYATSDDQEELKSQTTKRGLQQKSGLFVGLTSAQAFSIMKNIPN